MNVGANGSVRSFMAQPDIDIKKTATVNSLMQSINIT
jgi:hypothetical protein